MIDKTRQLKGMIQEKGLSTLIQIDGGVNEKTIYDISEAGADVFVAGSAIFGTGDYKKTISNLRKKLSTSRSRLAISPLIAHLYIYLKTMTA